jgi:hypothetical protein
MTLKQVYPSEYQWVQCAFKNSMIHNSAIHNTYRASLRSSSMREPRDPLLKVLNFFNLSDNFYALISAQAQRSRQA